MTVMGIFDKDYGNSLEEDDLQKNENKKIFSESEDIEENIAEIKKDESKEAGQDEKEAGKFREYKNVLSSYQTDSAIRKDRQARVNQSRRKQKDYEEIWAAAISRARSAWQSRQSEKSKEAENQRDSIRKKAENEKTARLKNVEDEETELRHNLSKIDQLKNEADRLISTSKARLSKLENYEIEGFECDPKAERLILQAFRNGYFSEKQKALAAEPPEKYCSVWAQTPQKLKMLEQNLLSTGFLYDLSTISSNEKVFGLFTKMAGVIAGLICFLLITLNQLSQNVIFNAFGMIAAFFASAGETYLCAALAAKLLKKNKKIPVHNSKSGVIAIILAIIIGGLMTRSMYSIAGVWRGINPGMSLGIGLMGGVLVWSFLSQSFMRSLLLSKSSFVRGKTYKALFRSAAKTVNQRRSSAGQSLLEDGEMDAMIVSYVHHHEYLQYLSLSARNQLIAETQKRLEEVLKIRQDAVKSREDTLKMQKKVKTHRNEAIRLNQETDRKLAEQLREFDRVHGIKAVPDFSIRSNLLDKDKQILSTAERDLGIPSDYTKDRDTAVKACRDVFENLNRSLQQAKEKEEKDILAIQAWTESGILPPFCNGSSESDERKYNYRLEPMVCLFNKSGIREQKVTIVDHKYRPVNFIYGDGEWLPGDEKSTENAAMLIGLLWQGFSRIAPPELLNIYLVDDTGRLQFSFPGKIRQDIPEFQHQTGITEISDQRNVQNRFRPLKGLYNDRDINELTRNIYSKFQAIDDYMQINRKEIQAAEEKVGVLDEIAAVNYCMSHGKTHGVKPYDIVIFVVPEGEENRNTYQSMNTMVNMIQQGAAKRKGFIPVILASESGYNSKWSSFVDHTRSSGVTCRVDLKTLQLQQ